MNRCIAWLLGAAAVTLAAAQERPQPIRPGLYFFFSPDSPGLPELARALRPHGARNVLLVTDFSRWPDSFLAALPDLGELSMVDEEGLALARRFGVRNLPCLVRVDAQGVHAIAGARLSLQEVSTCGH